MATRSATVILRKLRSGDAATLTDGDLLMRFAKAGEQAAFEVLVARHSAMVLGVCRRSLSNPADAEDACQAVFLVLADKAKRVRWQSSVANWLYAAARKISRNARLSAARRTARELRAATRETVSPVDAMSGRELLTALDEELEKLPPRYREPLVLCHLEGLTRDEAAARLGVPIATLKGQLERGRKRLADALTKRGCALGSALLLAASATGLQAVPANLPSNIQSALAGSPAPAVSELMKGVIVNGTLAKLKTLALCVTGLAVIVFGLGSMPTSAEPQKSEKAGEEKMSKGTPPPAGKDGPKIEVKERNYAGRVVDADGKPVPNAKLFEPQFTTDEPQSERDVKMVEVGQCDGEGKFQLKLKVSKFAPRDYLIAHSPGQALDWVELSGKTDSSKPIELRLPKEQVISGRVLNTEGRPVKGVHVRVASIYVPRNNDLDAYLKGWITSLREALSSPDKRMYLTTSEIFSEVKTDEQGRFELHGVGKDYLAYVLFEGAGIARSMPQIAARKGIDVKPYNNELLKSEHDDLRILNRFLGLMPPELTFIAEPGRVIEGVVTANGKPMKGLSVFVNTGWGDGINGQTDENGKYRLEGIPKRKSGYSVSVSPPKNSGFLSGGGNSEETDGVGVVRIDVKLVSGVVVKGRVIDKQTGKGVQSGIRFAPLPDNKFFGKGPGTDSYRRDRTMSSTDAEGRFQLNTIPGKTLVMVQTHASDKFNGNHLNPYRRAQPDPDHKDLFKHDADDDTWTVNTVESGIEFLDIEQAVKVVDIAENGETTVELTVDRGVVGKIAVQDADGKPLTGAWIAGLSDSWPITYKLPEATAPIYGLNPDKPRTIAVFHSGKKLAGTAKIRGDEKDPVIVKLKPTATIKGRFIEDGVPVANAEVTVNPPSRMLSELYRFTLNDRVKTMTDDKGNYTLPDIVPDVDFYLQIRKKDKYFGGKPKLGLQKLKAGETKDLGERNMELLR